MNSLFRTSVLIGLGLAGLLRAGTVSAAEPELLFEDDFSVLDSQYVPTDFTTCKVEGQQLSMATMKEYHGYSGFYPNVALAEADISIQVRLDKPKSQDSALAGLGFWGKNFSEYYAVEISDYGTVCVTSSYGGKRTYPLSWRESDLLKTGPDDWNELRVVTVKNRAVVYLNGTKLGTFRGQPPENGGIFGPYAASGKQDSTALFRNLKVFTPSGDDAVLSPEEADPNVIYFDQFAALDAGWGVESGNLGVSDNKLVLHADKNTAFRPLYSGVTVSAMDLSVKVKVDDNDPQSSSSAGITFWFLDGEKPDYYIFILGDDHKIKVYWYTGGEWKSIIAAKDIPAEAKFDPDSPAELRVVAKASRAVFYVNGVAVGTCSRTPLKGEWSFGVYLENGEAPATGEFSSLIVRKPDTAKP